MYLSLNQGVTSIREQYGTDAKRALTVRANDFVARLGSSSTNLIQGRIDLAVSAASSLGAYYEYGAICSVYYAKENLPTDEVLSSDLSLFLKLYTTLASCDSSLFKQADIEDDETFFGDEQLLVLREHKRIERNKKLAAQAKKVHGSVCKACGFDFAVNYGSIGKGFIEAHHLTPLATLKGAKVKLDARQDFTVLCANCHRMIHKSAFVGSVEEFRASHLRGPMV